MARHFLQIAVLLPVLVATVDLQCHFLSVSKDDSHCCNSCVLSLLSLTYFTVTFHFLTTGNSFPFFFFFYLFHSVLPDFGTGRAWC